MTEPTIEEQISAKFAGIELEEPAEEADTSEQTEEIVDEPEVMEEPETPEADPDIAAYLAKYNGDTDAAIKAAVEAQKIIGRQSAEVAEARQIQAQLEELRSLAQPTSQTPQYDPSSVDDYLAMNPQQIQPLLDQARASGDGFLYGKALSALAELDSAAAMDYHANAVADAKLAQLRQELAPALQSVQRQQTGNDFATAFQAQSQKHPDFAQVMNGITQDTLSGIPPELVATLQSGTPESKERVLETLYWTSKGQQAGNISEAVQNAAAQTQQQTQADRTNATVASTAASSDRVPVEKSPIEQFHEAFQNSNAFKKAAGLA